MNEQTTQIDRPPRRGWTAGRLTGLFSGGILALIGTLMALAGIAIVVLHFAVRDDDGFYTSGDERFAVDDYAIATEDIDLGNATDTAPDELLGRLRITVESQTDKPAFVGIARRSDVDAYLDGVGHSVLTDVDDPDYRPMEGSARPDRPAAQDFWAAQAEGSGEQVLEWEIEGGTWAVVMMNADARPGIDLDAKVGIEIDLLIWVGVGLLLVGLALAGGGIALMVIMRREATERF
jgi:hypothetical protein